MKKYLSFFNLLDRTGNLSITNLAVLIITIKLTTLQQFTLAETSAFLVAMLGYAHKRHVSSKQSHLEASDKLSEFVGEIDKLKSQISSLQLRR